MKNYLIIILIVLTVGIAVFCGDSSKKEKSYTEHLIGALDRADALALDTKIKTIKAALNFCTPGIKEVCLGAQVDRNQHIHSLRVSVIIGVVQIQGCFNGFYFGV